MILVFFILIICLVLIIWYFSTGNKIKRLSVKVDESLSGIDIALSKRYEVLTKMTEVVKGYAKHEKELILKSIELRKNMNVKELKEANDSMDNNFDKINAVVENYPDLKADENFRLLQRAIVDVEEHLQAARRLYNASVSTYNQLILSVPSNIIARRLNAKEKDFFEIEDNKKEVKIDLEDK